LELDSRPSTQESQPDIVRDESRNLDLGLGGKLGG